MRAKRVDANQREIVETLRRLGLSVLHLHTVGMGAPDIAVGYGGCSMLAEIKTKKGKFTKAQNEMMRWWTGGVYLLRTADDCMSLRDTLVRWHRKINGSP